jgi:hypothetical protein
VVSVSDNLPGVASRGAETTGAKVVSVSALTPGTTASLRTGAKGVRVRASLPGVQSRGALTTGANAVRVRVATFGVTVVLPPATLDGAGRRRLR